MKTVLFAVWLLLLMHPLMTIAQESESDALYLHNGSILRGKVLESTPGQGVKIEIVGNNVLVIPENEIQKVVMREGTTEITKEESGLSGFEIFPQVHFFGGSDESGGFTLTTAYAFPFRLSAGLGTGVEWFNGAMLPIYTNVSYKILPGTLSPFVYGQAGYALSLDNKSNDYYYYGGEQNNYGGVLAGAGAGIRKDFSAHAAFTFSVGYRYQRSRMTSEYNMWYDEDPNHVMKSERIEKYSRITLNVGFLFK